MIIDENRIQFSRSEQFRQYTITDLIPLEKLQKIQDAFALSNQVASTITDPDGVPITTPSYHCAVCTMIRGTEKGLNSCIISGKTLGRIAREQQRPVQNKCYGIGFTDAVAPIVVHGKHIANWIIGQYSTGEVDEQRVEEYAVEIGADPDKMKSAFKAMPKISAKEFAAKLSFLEIMANELSMMGYLHMLQKEQSAELHRIKVQLEEHQFHLEQKIGERTRALQHANAQLKSEISQKTKIQKRQARLITAIQSTAESIVITSPRGRIIYVNPAFEKLTGYSRLEVLGKTPKILQSGYHDKKFYSNLWQTIRNGHIWHGVFVNKKKDGSLYREESTISPVVDENGKILNYVAVKKDITKEHQLQAQLKQSQRLETIGTLAAGIAHEINTPIQYVISNTHFQKDVLKDLKEMQRLCQQLVDSAAATFTSEVKAINTKADEIDLDYLMSESEKAIEQSLHGLNKVSSIVKAMQEFSDPGSASQQLEDLNALIRSTIHVSRNIWDHVAEMELFLDESLPAIPLYAGKFKQILLDMLINATHALIEKYGMNPQTKGRIIITTRSHDHEVEMRLADTGAGIPESIVSRIFDPFFTTKGVGQGEGQSLAIAHKVIVENHAGSIGVESQTGTGTTFTIRIPVQETH